MTPIQPQITDERLDRLVRQVLTERADDVAAVAMPAQTMTAVVASHVRRRGIAERRTLLLVAAALLIVFAAGAVAVGSALIRRGPEPQPAPQPVVAPSLDATKPTPLAAAAEAEHLFYTVFEETPGRRGGLYRGQCESLRGVPDVAALGRRRRWRQLTGAVPGESPTTGRSSTCPPRAMHWSSRPPRRSTASRSPPRTSPS